MKIPERPTPTSNEYEYSFRRRQMMEVWRASTELTRQHPAEFSVRLTRNIHSYGVAVFTDIESVLEGKQVNFRFQVSAHLDTNGEQTNSIYLVQPHASSFEGGLVYRLDIKQGDGIERKHQKLKDLEQKEPIILKGLTDAFITGTDETVLSLYDQWAETNITAEQALEILRNIRTLRRPECSETFSTEQALEILRSLKTLQGPEYPKTFSITEFCTLLGLMK